MSLAIVRKKLTPDEITPPNIRYNGDCNCVEQTWDGGTTWTPTPGVDPRSAPGFRAPARTGDDPQCNAAANMVAALQQMVAGDISADNQAMLATYLLAVALLFVPVAGWIADAFLLVAEGILLLDQATIEAAFTPTVYDDLLCTFYCRLDADGQMSDEQLTGFLEDVFINYDFTVYSVISGHSDSLGPVGWSNMGALGTETGADCSACMCAWCYLWDFALTDGGWLVGAQGTWSGSAWLSQNISPTTYDILIYTECAGGCGQPMTTISCDAEWFPGTGAVAPEIGVYNRDGGGGYTVLTTPQTMTSGRATYTFDVSAFGAVNSLAVNLVSANDEGGSVALYSVKAEGTGTAPAFSGGADCS